MKFQANVSRRLFVGGLGLLGSFIVRARTEPQTLAADAPKPGPSHQVVACYFHRTVRCPTCKKISAYVEEAVRAGFASQVKDGSVKMVMIDFQDAKNRKFTEAYEITGPTLVIMDVRDGKIASWKPAPKVWSLVAKKDDFLRYVQSEIRGYLVGPRTAARQRIDPQTPHSEAKP